MKPFDRLSVLAVGVRLQGIVKRNYCFVVPRFLFLICALKRNLLWPWVETQCVGVEGEWFWIAGTCRSHTSESECSMQFYTLSSGLSVWRLAAAKWTRHLPMIDENCFMTQKRYLIIKILQTPSKLDIGFLCLHSTWMFWSRQKTKKACSFTHSCLLLTSCSCNMKTPSAFSIDIRMRPFSSWKSTYLVQWEAFLGYGLILCYAVQQAQLDGWTGLPTWFWLAFSAKKLHPSDFTQSTIFIASTLRISFYWSQNFCSWQHLTLEVITRKMFQQPWDT